MLRLLNKNTHLLKEMREHRPSDDQSADDTTAEHQSHVAEDRSTGQSHAADDRSTDQSHAADDRSTDQSHATDDRPTDQSHTAEDRSTDQSHAADDRSTDQSQASTDTGGKWTKDEDSNVSEISKELKSSGDHSGSHDEKGTSLYLRQDFPKGAFGVKCRKNPFFIMRHQGSIENCRSLIKRLTNHASYFR